MNPFNLEPGETIMGARPTEDGGYLLRVRTADGVETMHDIYPGQSAPEVEAWVAKTTTEIPVGILERAAWYADEYASGYDGDPAPENQAAARQAFNLARTLYAAARGDAVDWTQV
jgi:hypothetical protein